MGYQYPVTDFMGYAVAPLPSGVLTTQPHSHIPPTPPYPRPARVPPPFTPAGHVPYVAPSNSHVAMRPENRSVVDLRNLPTTASSSSARRKDPYRRDKTWSIPVPDPAAVIVREIAKKRELAEIAEIESQLRKEADDKALLKTLIGFFNKSNELPQPQPLSQRQAKKRELEKKAEIESQLQKEADEKTLLNTLIDFFHESNELSQPQLPPQDSEQNDHCIDSPELCAVNSQSLTKRLIASGGDIRALLSSDQPLSTMQAQWDDTGKEGAGQKIISKDDDEEVEEDEEEERFVRPSRLRIALSEGAASDGFPSAIALTLRWHPDYMQDRPSEAANLSIRAAFDTKYDEHYVFRDWRPSQGTWHTLVSLLIVPLHLTITPLTHSIRHQERLRSMMCDCVGEL